MKEDEGGGWDSDDLQIILILRDQEFDFSFRAYFSSYDHYHICQHHHHYLH